MYSVRRISVKKIPKPIENEIMRIGKRAYGSDFFSNTPNRIRSAGHLYVLDHPTEEGKLGGFAYLDRKGKIRGIAIDPGVQRKGAARSLISFIQEEGRFSRIIAEIKESNKVMENFLKKMEFSEMRDDKIERTLQDLGLEPLAIFGPKADSKSEKIYVRAEGDRLPVDPYLIPRKVFVWERNDEED